MSQSPFLKGVIRKAGISLALGLAMWVTSRALHFPPVFQTMFVLYVGLGFLIFLFLDAPPLPRFSGWQSGVALVLFYLLISTAYILGAMALPQYDPEDEKGKIEKLLKAKRERARKEEGNLDELLKRTGELEKKVQSLLVRLNTVSPAPAANSGLVADGTQPPGAMTLVAQGKELYDLQECYNCHKIGGKGSVKKRGPVMDNIGSYLTREDLKRKLFDPGYLYAEGFEKEHKKGVMPDKYRDLMTDQEADALAAYLATLKNPTVNTPKPVFVKSSVQHAFTVYGFVRGVSGKPLSGIEVQASPLKAHRHAKTAKTDQSGYYELFLHMHNEDAGTKVQVSARGVQKEFVAAYDPSDKVTKRQASVDLTVPAKQPAMTGNLP